MIRKDCLTTTPLSHVDPTLIFHEDNRIYRLMRQNISQFMIDSVCHLEDCVILEIGPYDFKPNPILVQNHNHVETVDIIINPYTTYVADLTKPNILPKTYYDAVYCLEVLEHCENPENMFKEIFQLLKPEGLLYISVPFQFRLHGPFPDYWRISEYGLKALAQRTGLAIVKLEAVIDPERPLFPLHYTMVCKK